MPNNGVVLVVTSAGSHQLELEKSIKEKSSKKNVKIYFTFSPFCREACGDSLPVYKRLSDNRMFNLSDFSSKSFLETVVYTVWKNHSDSLICIYEGLQSIDHFMCKTKMLFLICCIYFLGFKFQDIMKTNAWMQRNTKKDVVSPKSYKAMTQKKNAIFFGGKGGYPSSPLNTVLSPFQWVKISSFA